MKREEYICLCYVCSEAKRGYEDDVKLVYTRCDKCGGMTFCRAVKKPDPKEGYF